jgi:hypothetical protein
LCLSVRGAIPSGMSVGNPLVSCLSCAIQKGIQCGHGGGVHDRMSRRKDSEPCRGRMMLRTPTGLPRSRILDHRGNSIPGPGEVTLIVAVSFQTIEKNEIMGRSIQKSRHWRIHIWPICRERYEISRSLLYQPSPQIIEADWPILCSVAHCHTSLWPQRSAQLNAAPRRSERVETIESA